MNFIVAVDENYAIGNKGDLVYHIKEDLAYFKKTTLNKVVVMGSKTYLSLPKQPLPKRINIVLTSSAKEFEGTIIVHSLEELKKELKKYSSDDIFVIGGASIYNQLVKFCRFGYVTKIYGQKEADTFIENIEKNKNWALKESSPIFEENGLRFSFNIFENRKVEKM